MPILLVELLKAHNGVAPNAPPRTTILVLSTQLVL